MDRINAILNNKLFQECINEISELEMNRQFCRHDFKHLLDVARIAYILNLERGCNINKEIIYAAALLHDIGRHMQYKQGIPHEKASSEISDIILDDCDFKGTEKLLILDSISEHREYTAAKNTLAAILYESDKASRECFRCSAAYECKWPNEKMNLFLKY